MSEDKKRDMKSRHQDRPTVEASGVGSFQCTKDKNLEIGLCFEGIHFGKAY